MFKKPKVKRNNFTPKQNKRRYYLHYKLRKIDEIKINARQLQVNIPQDFEVDNNPNIKELCNEFHYNIQYTIK